MARKKTTRKKTATKKRTRKKAAAKPAASRKKRKRSAPAASRDIIAALTAKGDIRYYDGSGFAGVIGAAALYPSRSSAKAARALVGKSPGVKVIGVFSASASPDQIRKEFGGK